MRTLIRGGQIIDGIRPEPFSNTGVYIDGESIEGMDAVQSSPRVDFEIDAEGMTILPGFIDAHLHLLGISSLDFPRVVVTEPAPLCAIRAAADAERLIRAGYTTVRSAGSSVEVAVRNAIRERRVNGPTVLAANRIISKTGGHGDIHSLSLSLLAGLYEMPARLADGPWDCRKAVREQIREDVDLIKICTTGGVTSENDDPLIPQFTREEVTAITDEAHRFGRPVAAHAESPPGIRLAVECGVDTIEHAVHLDEETCALLVEKRIPIVTTFTITELCGQMFLDQRMQRQFEKLQRVRQEYAASIKMARTMGVDIVTGTDLVGPVPLEHGKSALEMVLLTQLAGFSPMEAIQAATSRAAKAIGLGHRIGAVRPDRDADLVIVKKDPLGNLKSLLDPDNIAFVIKKGAVVHQTM